MSSSSVEWSCSTCRVALDKRQRTHPPCHTHTTWTCLLTQRSGTHDTYKHHAKHCEYCSPERKEAIREENEANKENRIAAVEEDEKGQSAVHHRSHILLPPAVNTYRHDDLSHADFSLDSPQWSWKEWGADEVAFRARDSFGVFVSRAEVQHLANRNQASGIGEADGEPLEICRPRLTRQQGR